MDSDARTFSTTYAVSSESLDGLQSSILELMTVKIRPHAVKLVDAWSVPDFLLNSALGRYDGKVYETLFDMAHRQNPLNKTTFNVKWREEEIVLGSGHGWEDPIAKL
jgi:acyl-CoA oxidase